MDILNRSAVILRPKQPYLAWTKLEDAEGLAEDVFETLREEPNAYLVPEFDEDLWPKGRTFEMFGDWFEVQTHAMIVDVYFDEAIDYLG